MIRRFLLGLLGVAPASVVAAKTRYLGSFTPTIVDRVAVSREPRIVEFAVFNPHKFEAVVRSQTNYGDVTTVIPPGACFHETDCLFNSSPNDVVPVVDATRDVLLPVYRVYEDGTIQPAMYLSRLARPEEMPFA